jgi:class 3 adenylate cyclase
MAWNAERAEKRIKAHLNTVPSVEPGMTLAKLAADRALVKERGLMDRLPVRRTFPVDGVHLYAQLLDFDDLVAENGQETTASHERVLQFLHVHYSMWDGIVDGDSCDRVDYHGARLHAVVTAPAGDPKGQLERAIALAAKLAEASAAIGRAHGFPSRIRFGLDQGKCLAMSTGRAHEKDTLFLGSPANHAAKLASAADVEGVFLTPGAQRILGNSTQGKSAIGQQMALNDAVLKAAASRHRFEHFEAVVAKLTNPQTEPPTFRFHRGGLPLSSIKFSELYPSNSVRRGMASIFADIDGFTRFVDEAIQQGAPAIKNAVTSIHVIREELNDVLTQDFGGKRVRFIGDCIQGCLAAGKTQDDPASTVREAALCASAMQDSFELCERIVRSGAAIDLAIGIEYGPVPLTRIGDPGSDSIRCTAGRAVVQAEREQQALSGGGIRLGAQATAEADWIVRKHFAAAAAIMNYDAAADLLGSMASPAVQVLREQPAARPHTAAFGARF